MAFFDLPSDAEMDPDVRRMLEERKRATGITGDAPTWRTYGRSRRIMEFRIRGFQDLNMACSFPWGTKCLAVMLLAHVKGCRACFNGSRRELDKLGFDEAALDGICAHPESLPLTGRDRLFVEYVLKIATRAADLTPKDFREMEANGFTRDDVQEMTGFVAYWTMNMILNQVANAALADE